MNEIQIIKYLVIYLLGFLTSYYFVKHKHNKQYRIKDITNITPSIIKEINKKNKKNKKQKENKKC